VTPEEERKKVVGKLFSLFYYSNIEHPTLFSYQVEVVASSLSENGNL
jgi:hypothetical protein